MKLSPPTSRKHLHTRKIECQGYLRDDGLWDIEGHITDVKTYPFHNDWRGMVTPGDPIHNMSIRLTVDDEFVVRQVEAVMAASPYHICPEVVPNFQRLVGVAIKPGWKRTVRKLLGGTNGCTHLVELLSPVATVAFQTIRPYKRHMVREQLGEGEEDPTVRRPAQIGTCYGWSPDKEVVGRYVPEHYTGAGNLPDKPSKAAGESD